MDESLRHFNPNPLLSANIFSQGFFWWVSFFYTFPSSSMTSFDSTFSLSLHLKVHRLKSRHRQFWQFSFMNWMGGNIFLFANSLRRTKSASESITGIFWTTNFWTITECWGQFLESVFKKYIPDLFHVLVRLYFSTSITHFF